MTSASRTTCPSRVAGRSSGPPSQQGAAALGVPQDAVTHLRRQIESGPVVFQNINNPQTLPDVVETVGEQIVENPFAGMAKRRVSEVVTKSDGLGQVLVELQRPGHGTGDLRHLQGMGQTGPVMITFRGREIPGFCA